jgi:hypothetical protein
MIDIIRHDGRATMDADDLVIGTAGSHETATEQGESATVEVVCEQCEGTGNADRLIPSHTEPVLRDGKVIGARHRMKPAVCHRCHGKKSYLATLAQPREPGSA